MQNIKKIFIFSIFMIYSIECLADKALIHAGENAAKTLALAITDVAQTLAPVVVDAAKGVGVEAAQGLAPAVADAAKTLGSDAAIALANSNLAVAQLLASASVDAARGVGADAAIAIANSNLAIVKEIMPVASVIAAVGVTIYGVTQLQPIAKDTYYFIYPTEEQQTSTAVAAKRLKYLKAEEKFVDCMISSKPQSEIDASGLPVDCEELARIFAACGGKSEVDKIAHDLMGFRK